LGRVFSNQIVPNGPNGCLGEIIHAYFAEDEDMDDMAFNGVGRD
jgi:hypothetical protein